MYFVYILESVPTGRFYVGSSADPDARLEQHNRGKTQSTKAYAPWHLIWKEAHETRALATRRERYLKSLKSHVALERLMHEGDAVE